MLAVGSAEPVQLRIERTRNDLKKGPSGEGPSSACDALAGRIEVESSTQDEEIKARIRQLFSRVKPEHRQYVLTRLKGIPDNEKRLSYLRGWTKHEVS